jgi:hypothetical protein
VISSKSLTSLEVKTACNFGSSERKKYRSAYKETVEIGDFIFLGNVLGSDTSVVDTFVIDEVAIGVPYSDSVTALLDSTFVTCAVVIFVSVVVDSFFIDFSFVDIGAADGVLDGFGGSDGSLFNLSPFDSFVLLAIAKQFYSQKK